MKSYTLRARAFLGAVWLLGLVLLILTWLGHPARGEHSSPEGIGLAVVLAAIAGASKFTLLRSSRFSEQATISLGFLITFGSLLTLGLRAGVLVGATSGLASSLYPRRQPLHQILFNVSAILIAAWLAGKTLLLCNGGFGATFSLPALGALLLAALIYFCVNSCLVATAIGLCMRQNAFQLWRDNCLWSVISYLAGASLAALGQFLFPGQAAILLLALPVLAFTYQSYKLYMEKNEQKEQHIAELQAGRQQLADVYLSTVKSLATAIGAKDQYTHAHILRVQYYALAIAKELGVEGDELEAIKTGALLHDIGKVGVPDYVLLKPGPLTADEYAKMKLHVVIGADILEPVQFPWPVLDVVRYHHERWDGKGYPEGLAGEAIPRTARIMAVADVYDALTSARPYRTAWSRERTLAFFQAEAGIQFDPEVVTALMRVVPCVELAPSVGVMALEATHRPAPDVAGQIHRTATELWVLYEVGQALNRHAPLRERLEDLGSKLTSVLPGNTCAFMLYDPLPASSAGDATGGQASLRLSRTLRVCAAAGVNTDLLYAHDIVNPECFCSQVARTRTAYRGHYPDETMPWSIAHDPTRPIRSFLAVPLLHEGEVLGTISLYHTEPDSFRPEDEQLLHMIADQVQSTVYRDHLHDITRADSLTDSLTGLPNRRYLDRFVATSLSGNGAYSHYALIYLDLDDFKQINDTFGHAQGDAVLRTMGQLLPQELRGKDTIVRLHGDEFLIVLPDTREAEASEVAARIRSVIGRCLPPLVTAGNGGRLQNVSIGIACCPTDGTDIEHLVGLADQRMYADKGTHEKHISLHDHSGQAPIDTRSALVIVSGLHHREAVT